MNRKEGLLSKCFMLKLGWGLNLLQEELSNRSVNYKSYKNNIFVHRTGTVPSEESSTYLHSEAQELSGPCRH